MVHVAAPTPSQDQENRNNRFTRMTFQVLKALKEAIIFRGFPFGVAFSLLVSSLAFFIGDWAGNMLEEILFEMDLFGITPAWTFSRLFALLAFVYTFCIGFQTVDTAHSGIPTLFEMRLKHITFKEGLAWWFPKPIGKILIEDMRTQPIDLNKTEILTRDGLVVSVDASLVYQIVNLFAYINTAGPREQLTAEALDQLRFIIGQHDSTELYDPDIKKNLGRDWLGKEPVPGQDYSIQDDGSGLRCEVAVWGLAITKAQISNIRLPTSIEEANANKKVEEAEKVSETTEANHAAGLMQIYMEKGLTPQEALNAMQAERGKATRIIIEGGASDLVKAGALIGGLTGNIPTPDNDPPHGGGKPPLRNRRRQPKSKE